MNPASVIALVSGVLAVAAGALALRLARAPGSADQRWFAVVACASAGYAFCNLATTLPGSPLAVIWLSRVQVATLVVNVWAWHRYGRGLAQARPGPALRFGGWALLAAAPLPLVPGLVFGDVVVDRPYPPLDVVYRQALTTPSGDAFLLLLVVVALAIEVRFVRAALRRVPQAGPVAIAFALMLLLGMCDAVATAFLLPVPFLLDVGSAAPLLAVAWIGASRFISAAEALERIGADLWRQVEDRTRELQDARESLLQAEKLAALGQFANGVAHEVNNPAAVVTASLRYLAEDAAGRPADPETAAALADAELAMQRITSLVRKLVDAGRIALAPTRTSVGEVGEALENVIARQPPALRDSVTRVGAVEPLHVPLRPDALEHVLEILVTNAGDALPKGRAGRVAIRTERRGDATIRITVSDDGIGMGPDVLRRAFDPFFTTKPFGEGAGAGLGLSVARGLVEAAGGTLWLESVAGAGTNAVIEVPDAAARAAEQTPPALARPAPRG